MAIGIPRVENCCCCCSLKCGIIALSVVFMVFTLMNLVVSIFIVGRVGVSNPSIEDEGDPIADIMIGDLVVDVLMIILCVSLVVAAIKGNYLLCRIWMIGAIVYVTIIFIFTIISSSFRASNRPETAHQLGHLWAGLAFEGGLLGRSVSSYVDCLLNSSCKEVRFRIKDFYDGVNRKFGPGLERLASDKCVCCAAGFV
ncbi:hypothetical protein Bbelb_426390 [Branchiostoma belcheri]|nr:hypothetical protein Bbelb_426390 [Branchiostoma belcheri]